MSNIHVEYPKNNYTLDDVLGFAEWIAYNKKHGGVKPLQEAMIVYKISTTKELFEIYINKKQEVKRLFNEKQLEKIIEVEKNTQEENDNQIPFSPSINKYGFVLRIK